MHLMFLTAQQLSAELKVQEKRSVYSDMKNDARSRT